MLREERRLRVLRGIFGPKRDAVTKEWRKLHNEELNNLCPHPISRRMRCTGHVARTGGRGVYRVLVGKPEGKTPLDRLRRRWSIILRWVFRKWYVGLWTGLSCLVIGTGGGDL